MDAGLSLRPDPPLQRFDQSKARPGRLEQALTFKFEVAAQERVPKSAPGNVALFACLYSAVPQCEEATLAITETAPPQARHSYLTKQTGIEYG